MAIRAYVWLWSVVPVLPATGRLTMPAVADAVAPPHWPNADWLPTGQRAASSATFAMSGSITCLHCGFVTSCRNGLPFESVIEMTGVGAQRDPLLSTVPYADAICSGVTGITPSVNAPNLAGLIPVVILTPSRRATSTGPVVPPRRSSSGTKYVFTDLPYACHISQSPTSPGPEFVG